jgi:hypothetical protein
MITRTNLKRLTPTLAEPNVTPKPTQQSLQLFDLTNQSDIALLCHKLESMQTNSEKREPLALKRSKQEALKAKGQKSIDNRPIMFFASEPESPGISAVAKTPTQTLGPPSR